MLRRAGGGSSSNAAGNRRQVEPGQSLAELNDSKKLSPEQRVRLAAIIHEIGICEIAQSSVEEIDEINILQASLMAMRRALDQLSARLPDTMPILVLVGWQ